MPGRIAQSVVYIYIYLHLENAYVICVCIYFHPRGKLKVCLGWVVDHDIQISETQNLRKTTHRNKPVTYHNATWICGIVARKIGIRGIRELHWLHSLLIATGPPHQILQDDERWCCFWHLSGRGAWCASGYFDSSYRQCSRWTKNISRGYRHLHQRHPFGTRGHIGWVDGLPVRIVWVGDGSTLRCTNGPNKIVKFWC